jgi:hypothetical protein
MDRDDDGRRQVRLERPPPIAGHPDVWPEHAPGGDGAHEHEHVRLHQAELPIEPWPTCSNVARLWALVETAFAPGGRPPAEVLHDVRHEGGQSVDPGCLEGVIQDPAGRTDERTTGAILLVAWLLADEHERRGHGTLADDDLGRSLPELACATPLGVAMERPKLARRGHRRALRSAASAIEVQDARAVPRMPSCCARAHRAGMRTKEPPPRPEVLPRTRSVAEMLVDLVASGAPDRTRDPRVTYMGLRWSGLTSEQAANLTARLAGIGSAPGGWTVGNVQRLLFLRWLVESGRLGS